MPLIDYDSESDSDSEVVKNTNVVTKRPRIGLDLPMPKRNKRLLELETEQPESKASGFVQADLNKKTFSGDAEIGIGSSNSGSNQVRVLGGGVKVKYFDGEIAIPEKEIGATINSHKINSVDVIPAYVAARIAKYGSADMKPMKKKPADPALLIAKKKKLLDAGSKQTFNDLFSMGSTGNSSNSKSTSSSNASTYKPMIVENNNLLSNQEASHQDQHAENHNSSSGGLSKFIPKGVNVVDFDLDEFYEENEKLSQAGLLEESKRPVGSVAGGKHQITTLLRSAQQNHQGLEEMHAEGRRNKREARAKHGF